MRRVSVLIIVYILSLLWTAGGLKKIKYDGGRTREGMGGGGGGEECLDYFTPDDPLPPLQSPPAGVYS